VLAASSFLIGVGVARSGGPSALGLFVLIYSLTLFASRLLQACLGDPLVVEAHGQGRTDGVAAARPVAAAALVLGLAAALVWLLAGGHVPGLPPPRPARLLLVLLLPLGALQDLARSLRLVAAGERRMFTGDLLVAAARVGALGLAAAGARGLSLGLWAVASGGVACLASISTLLGGSRRPGALSRLWRLGRWLMGETLLYGLTIYGIWVLFVPKAGMDVAGRFRAAQQLFAPVQTVLVGLNTVLLGRLARVRGTPATAVGACALVQAGLITAWSAVAVGFGPAVTARVFGDGFQLPRSELLALAGALLATTGFDLAALGLRAAGRGRTLIRARGAVAVIGLAGVILFGTTFLRVAAVIVVSQLVGIWLAWPARPAAAPASGSRPPPRGPDNGDDGDDGDTAAHRGRALPRPAQEVPDPLPVRRGLRAGRP